MIVHSNTVFLMIMKILFMQLDIAPLELKIAVVAKYCISFVMVFHGLSNKTHDTRNYTYIVTLFELLMNKV